MSKEIQTLHISKRIFTIRGLKVMLDRDLAELYGVETRRLNEQVKRNIDRFPEDFMFQLSKEELQNWISQNATSNLSVKMSMRKLPFAFTEHGILMLSNVLKSKNAILVSIQIIRVFNKMREIVQEYKDILNRIARIEKRQDIESKELWKAIRAIQRNILK